MIGTGFRAESQVRADESGCQLRNEFFHAVGLIAETLAQFPIASACVGCPVSCFVCTRAVVIHWSEESGEWWQGDGIVRGGIKRPIPLVCYARVAALNER